MLTKSVLSESGLPRRVGASNHRHTWPCRSRGALMLALLTVLAGCGGGGGGGSASGGGGGGATVLTGQFVDSAVSGIRWETATRSGTTDANGTFRYLAGETVRFFLGQLLLGEATGSGRISLFDIVPGAVAPTTEAEIYAILFDAKEGDLLGGGPLFDDGAGAGAGPFRRVLLLALLLQSLDTDGDPDNGIEISAGIAALLAADSIDLDDTLRGVQGSRGGAGEQLLALLARAKADGLLGPTRQPRQLHEVLRHLYASLALDFVPRVVTTETVVGEPDASRNSVTTNLYDDAGRRTHRTVVSALGTSVTQNFFDDNGNLERVTQDEDNDGAFEAVRLFEYDPLGRPTYRGTDSPVGGSVEQYLRIVYNEDGTIHSEETLGGFGGGILSAGLDTPVALEVVVPVIRTYTYESGLRIREEVNLDGAEGAESVTEFEWQDGNMVLQRRDSDNDGNIDLIVSSTFQNGRLTSQIEASDEDDDATTGIEQRTRSTAVYENGKLTQSSFDIDDDGDGPNAYTEINREVFAYEADRLKMISYFSSGNEVANQTKTYDYDGSGRLMRATDRYPGSADAPYVAMYVYDDNGVLREERNGRDAEDDGVIDAVDFLRQRDAQGRTVLKQRDWNADGFPEVKDESSYNEDGNLHVLVFTEDSCCTEGPFGPTYGDGVREQTTTTTYAYGDTPAWWSVLGGDDEFFGTLIDAT